MAVLRKIKEGFKKTVNKIKLSKQAAAGVKEKKVSTEVGREALGIRETAVEQTKFSTPERPKPYRRMMPQDLPWGYQENKIVLQVRDPWWLHAYWEVTPATLERLRGQFGDAVLAAKRALRVYDISNIIFDGNNAHRFFDIEIQADSNNWYIDTAGPGRSWCVDLGLVLADGRFITIVRSNLVHTPIEGPSWITDEEWMIPEEMFARLYGMGFGLGRSSPVGKLWQERLRRELFSGILASPTSPIGKVPGEKSFWLVVNTELIIYGATECNAKLSVQGRDIKLRPDGTFSLRFALPDGRQLIPVKAVSADNRDERTITPIVTRETR